MAEPKNHHPTNPEEMFEAARRIAWQSPPKINWKQKIIDDREALRQAEYKWRRFRFGL